MLKCEDVQGSSKINATNVDPSNGKKANVSLF